jgi:hypothetical protein
MSKHERSHRLRDAASGIAPPAATVRRPAGAKRAVQGFMFPSLPCLPQAGRLFFLTGFRIPAPETRCCVFASWREAPSLSLADCQNGSSRHGDFHPVGRSAAAATTYCASYDVGVRL